MIVMVAAAVAVPVFRGSFQGLALRSTARDIIMAGRYARARAALRSRQVAVVFYLDQNRFEVVELAPEETTVDVADMVHDFEGAGLWGYSPQEKLKETLSYQVKPLFARAPAAGVKLVRVATENLSRSYEGVVWVYYYPNGMCDPYTVELTDRRNHRLTISFSSRGRALIND